MSKEVGELISFHLSRPDLPSDERRSLERAFKGLKEPVEPGLEKKWETQAKTLAQKFAPPLGLSEDEYIAGLPEFPSIPLEDLGRFGTPLLVQPPVPERGLGLDSMLKIIGVRSEPWPKFFEDWSVDFQGFQTPSAPYATRIRAKKVSHVWRTPEIARKELLNDERAGNVSDGLALLMHTNIFRRDSFWRLSLPGTQVTDSRSASLTSNCLGAERLRSSNTGAHLVLATRKIEIGTLR